MNTLKALKRSLGLDLYMWTTGSLLPHAIYSWRSLYRQFGVDSIESER